MVTVERIEEIRALVAGDNVIGVGIVDELLDGINALYTRVAALQKYGDEQRDRARYHAKTVSLLKAEVDRREAQADAATQLCIDLRGALDSAHATHDKLTHQLERMKACTPTDSP